MANDTAQTTERHLNVSDVAGSDPESPEGFWPANAWTKWGRSRKLAGVADIGKTAAAEARQRLTETGVPEFSSETIPAVMRVLGGNQEHPHRQYLCSQWQFGRK